MGTASQLRTMLGPPHLPAVGTTPLRSRPRSVETLLETVDLRRLEASRRLDESSRAEMGQFFTAAQVARLMASMFETRRRSIRLLDPGAGVGSLSAAFVEAICGSKRRPAILHVTAYELDPTLIEPLQETLEACRTLCRQYGVRCTVEVRAEDFIAAGAAMLGGDLFDQRTCPGYDCIILNPPYRKIHSDSKERSLLRGIGVEASNLYAGFLAIASKLLVEKGELVAITPRSFCNGPYFKPFRRLLLESLTLRRFHVFESRNRAFESDQVLQENVIFHALKGRTERRPVLITSSEGADDVGNKLLEVAYDELIQPGDPDCFIRLMTDEIERHVARRMAAFSHRLQDLDLSVSTGRVVDFRAREFLRARSGKRTAPLIYPMHFNQGRVEWPRPEGKKPNAIAVSQKTRDLLNPDGTYVLTKRFSSKEERRRVVAALYTRRPDSGGRVGFENHLNYYHRNGGELPFDVAKGLAVFLNSTLIDAYFRQLSGHTQVNATDLRSLRYPALEQLEALGARVRRSFPDQAEIDRLIEEELFPMPDDASSMDPVAISAGTLSRHYARERKMKRLPVRISRKKTITLSPGGHSELVKKILDDFCALFTPGATIVYVGDTENKWAYFDDDVLNTLEVRVEEHGKMPDVVVYDEDREWLVLIEAVTSHGAIDAKRHLELKELFIGSQAGLIFTTAFPDRKTLAKYLQEITWETEVWIAESPTHLIHFDGERFLGPYEDREQDE